MKEPLGIDLGTTFSAIAQMELGRPAVIRDAEGKAITPSMVYFPGSGAAPIVGHEARAMQEAGEPDVASLFKREMGDRSYRASFFGMSYSAVDLSAMVLRHLVSEIAKVDDARAIITVPAYFDNSRREATIEAGRQAGIDVIGTINEPTAAAIAFGLDRVMSPKTLLIYDLGGGTFDVTIVSIAGKEITVLGSSGDHQLGGVDWDARIMRHIAASFEAEFGVDPMGDPLAAQDLKVRAEAAKMQLSSLAKTRVSLTHGSKRGTYEVGEAAFRELTQDLIERTMLLTEEALESVALDWGKIDCVVPVGGATRMPMVTDALKERFRGEFATGINPDEAIALGAAIEASRRDATPSAFALGGISLRDVMAHSLGMVAENKDRSRYVNSTIIRKNQPIPSLQVREFQQRTRSSGTVETEVYMLQGDAERPLDCSILGKYVFSGIEPEKTGVAILDIGYSYDENGIVHVTATQRSSGRQLDVNRTPLEEDMSWLDSAPRDLDVAREISVFVAIDLSGSMSGDPLKKAKAAAKTFIAALDLQQTSAGLNIFADRVKTSVELTRCADKLNRGIDEWTIGQVGGGNDTHPFNELRSQLRHAKGDRFVVVLTDGIWSNQGAALRAADELKAEGVQIIALGFGGADKAFLGKMANSEDGAVFTSLENISSQFSRIAQVMTDSQTAGLSAPKSGAKLRFF